MVIFLKKFQNYFNIAPFRLLSLHYHFIFNKQVIAERDALAKQLRDREAEIRQLSTVLEAMNKQLTKEEKRNLVLAGELGVVEQQVRKLRSDLQASKERAEEGKKDTEKEMAALQKRVQELQVALQDNNNRLRQELEDHNV